MSLIDVDTLVRHDLPVVMVVGNNSCWGLEKHPMRFLYGYDVAADLAPQTAYDQVVQALGGDGETVSKPGEIGAALDRAFDSGVPYLVNVLTDPEVGVSPDHDRCLTAWRSATARRGRVRRGRRADPRRLRARRLPDPRDDYAEHLLDAAHRAVDAELVVARRRERVARAR